MRGSTHTDGVDEVLDLAHRRLPATTTAGASGSRRSRPTGATSVIAWRPGIGGSPRASCATAQPDGRGKSPVDAESEHGRLVTALAHGAVQLISARLAGGEPARTVVSEVLDAVFGAGGRASDDRLERVLRDRNELDRIVATAMEIIGIGQNR